MASKLKRLEQTLSAELRDDCAELSRTMAVPLMLKALMDLARTEIKTCENSEYWTVRFSEVAKCIHLL